LGHGTRKTRKTRKTSQPKFISLQLQPSPSSSTLTLGSPSAAQPSTPPRHAPHPPDQTPAPAPAVQAPNPRRRPAKPLLPVAATRQPPSPRLQERVRARRIRLLDAPGSCSPGGGGGRWPGARVRGRRRRICLLSRPRLALQAPAVHGRRRVGPRDFGGEGGGGSSHLPSLFVVF